jgi:putative ABC transport system ATP-binding protein
MTLIPTPLSVSETPRPEEDRAVEIRHLNYFFGQGELRKQVLFDVNLDLPKGQIVIMTGPSGSGKTTLLSLIGALRTVQDGSLKVMGQELVGLSKAALVKVRCNIGFIFQAHNLFESLTACQNVEMAIELWHTRPEKRQQAMAILKQLGLGTRIDYKPNALSGGQNQRVAIARALVNQPPLILADEPTAALDKKSGREVVMLMQQLAQSEGRTILMVTHDNRILDVADRIISMVDGHLESDESLDHFVSTRDPKALDRRMFMT